MGRRDRKGRRLYHAVRRSKRLARYHLKRAIRDIRARGEVPTKLCWVVDINSGKRFHHKSKGVVSCLTSARATSNAMYVTSYGRVLSTRDMLNLQGMPASRLDNNVVNDNAIRSMIGNAFSLNVVERLWCRALYCAGLVQHRLVDRWDGDHADLLKSLR